MSYKIFLDDIRNPANVKKALHRIDGWVDFPSLFSWIIVRSYDQFVQLITSKMTEGSFPSVISFDHDLSWEDAVNHGSNESGPLDYKKFKEKTGYDCAQWLVNHCIVHNIDLPDYYVHSFNPIGRMNIFNYLYRFEQFKRENPDMFEKPNLESPKIIIP